MNFDVKLAFIAILCMAVSSTAYAENTSCKAFREEFQVSYYGLQTTGPTMSQLMTKPGIGPAIERKKIAQKGLAFAKQSLESAQALLALNCLDYAGRETDWTKAVKEAVEILNDYQTQANAI